MKKWLIQLKVIVLKIRDFLDEKTMATIHSRPLSRMHRFAHFCLMVTKGFSRNRCFMQASALAYTSLLALIPMLFVAVSISSSLLKQEGGQGINHFVDKLLVSMTPPNLPSTNHPPSNASVTNTDSLVTATDAKSANDVSETNAVTSTPTDGKPSGRGSQNPANREQIARTLNGLVSNIQRGTMGVTGITVLIFMAVSLLSRIESTFNDIWGVKRGRNWLARIIQYWAILSLGPLMIAGAMALTNSPHLQPARDWLNTVPLVGRVVLKVVPILLLCLILSIFYFIVPNTKVRWSAAFIGGTVSGVLWHVNSYLSVFYVSRWVTYSNIFGSLAIIPLLMIGLYFSWLILLFGAQVSHAFQNRRNYLQEKQAENINQRGREFIALRMMESIGQRYQQNLPPVNAPALATDLLLPECLAEDILEVLSGANLLVEGTGELPAYVPARPLESITCHDILLAMRTGQGQELSTRDEPARTEVFGEFEKILEAEKKASAAITVLMMVNRAEQKALPSSATARAVLRHRTE